ncbi:MULTISPECIES: hypothetical protein [Kribbella]|uniref:Uncharacterized protein n=1 Tax=Kribbella karoonensis TaxID=324851 RepID=A0ABN2D292_9ACTN
MATIASGRAAAWLDRRCGVVNRVSVSHSARGFALVVEAVPTWRWVVGAGTESTLSALGHPCCGRGLGRVPFVGTAAYRLLSVAVRTGVGPDVFSRPISVDEALAVCPTLDVDRFCDADE